MTDLELENTFEIFFNKEKMNLDLDYLEQFIGRIVKGLIREYGHDELKNVIYNQTKENQEVDNDLSMILEVGSLAILFHENIESSDLVEVQDRLVGILYFLNKAFAQKLIQNGLLNPNCNTLYSYSDLLTVFTRTGNLFMEWCYDNSAKTLISNAKSQVYANSLRLSYLLLPQ